MERRAPIRDLPEQVVARLSTPPAPVSVFEGSDHVISTGSTLLDLAISGGRFANGGIPGGILVEIFGPASCGKTVMLCELAGGIQRQGGRVMFCDPEARLNRQFARLFGFEVSAAHYDQPDTVKELFDPIKKWSPQTGNGAVNGVFADSLAALSTEMEMADKDQYGMRRAKEFSEQCRLVTRILANRNLLMVCSNQVRQNIDAGPFQERYSAPGGMAIGFYSSLRLRCHSPKRVTRIRTIGKGDVKRTVGVETTVEVYKSSVWEPYHSAPVTILFEYGIDDVRANLDFVKSTTGNTKYMLGERSLGSVLDRAIKIVEEEGLEEQLKRDVVEMWRGVESKFKMSRVTKRR